MRQVPVRALCWETDYNEEEDTKAAEDLFCSELVARVYHQVGILDKKLRSEAYLPKDFSTDPNAIMADHYAKDHKGKNKIEHHHKEFKIVKKLARDYDFDASGESVAEAVEEEAPGKSDNGGRNTFMT